MVELQLTSLLNVAVTVDGYRLGMVELQPRCGLLSKSKIRGYRLGMVELQLVNIRSLNFLTYALPLGHG